MNATSIVGAINEQEQIHVDTMEPNGFINKTDSTISFNIATPDRTVTVSPAVTSFSYYILGKKYTKSTNQTVQISNTEGLHAIYFDGATLTALANPTATQIKTIITTKSWVCLIYWNATSSLYRILEERHGITMDAVTHVHLHNSLGTQWISGLALGDFSADQNGSLAAHAQFSTALGTIRDEDIDHNLTAVASTTGLEIFYLDGANWRWATNAGYSIRTAGTGRMAYNSSGTQVEVTNGRFALCHIFATNDSNLKPIAIQGQAEYLTLNAARLGAQTEINSLILTGLPALEFKPIGSIIFETDNTYGNAVKSRIRTTDTGANYVDWRRDTLSPASPGNDHGSLSGLTDDDHTQYVNNTGSRNMVLFRRATAASYPIATEVLL
jgi:hypothetical protein